MIFRMRNYKPFPVYYSAAVKNYVYIKRSVVPALLPYSAALRLYTVYLVKQLFGGKKNLRLYRAIQKLVFRNSAVRLSRNIGGNLFNPYAARYVKQLYRPIEIRFLSPMLEPSER